MKSDIEIARSIELTKIKQVAANFGMPLEYVTHYGRYMAKVSEEIIDEEKVKNSNLILVTAITPTKAGIGKTTVSIGLALGLNKIGKKAESYLCLARAVTRSMFRYEGWCSRRWLCTGSSYGENQSSFHWRLPRHHFCT